MIFLKRLEAQGFKSFAEPIDISFEHSLIGIVGPNGCGKSNINDAIRWCLGEQSMKSLRGNSSQDVIFNGTATKKGLNNAFVTLTLRNMHHAYNESGTDLKITRKLSRDSGTNEYFINNEKALLRDILELALDTKITKSSLSFITQNKVTTFSEMNPYERRVIFEEAAGVAKYKKRKAEYLRKKAQIEANMEKIEIVLTEINRKLPRLKSQSKKARLFQTKKDTLNKIEKSILVKDIRLFTKQLTEFESEITNQGAEKSSEQKELFRLRDKLSQLKQDNKTVSSHLDDYSKEYQTLIEDIGKWKVALIKYRAEQATNNPESDTDKETLEKAYNKMKFQLDIATAKLTEFLNQQDKVQDELSTWETKQQNANVSAEQKKKFLVLNEFKINEAQNASRTHSNLAAGVRNIMNNKHNFTGIIGLVNDIISYEDKYKHAFGAMIAGRWQNIVVNSQVDSKKAIDFLKHNRAGTATFLPLDLIKPQYISDDLLFALKKTPGFINTANNVVIVEEKYQKIADYLFARYLLVDNYDNAIIISKVTRQKFNVVTLDAEIIRPYGAIFGGRKTIRNMQTSNVNIDQLKQQNETYKQELETLVQEINTSEQQINLLKTELLTNESKLGGLRNEINRCNEQLKQIELQLKGTNNGQINAEIADYEMTLNTKLKDAEVRKDVVEKEIDVARSTKEQFEQEIDDIQTILDSKSASQSAVLEKLSKVKAEVAVLQQKISFNKNILVSEYGITYEKAASEDLPVIEDEEANRELIKEIRYELSRSGNINFDSVEQYAKEQERYDFTKKEFDQLATSFKNLDKSVHEMDEIVTKEFLGLIKELNESLPETFVKLFGGGSAKVWLTDPDDLDNTGVEIKVTPPGKRIINLNLLSGGEKSLVALSVLLAIVNVKPLPLVILDEAEAQLDPANVERFVRYVREFTKKTQFIIVTHRIGTMEHCDILYGATMQSKGITKIVQIKMLEAARKYGKQAEAN